MTDKTKHTEHTERTEKLRIGRRAKLLCPQCLLVRRAWQEGDSDTVYLECGNGVTHSRTPYLLPVKEGTLGLEGIIWRKPEALRLWPPIKDAFNELDEQYIKENYWR